MPVRFGLCSAWVFVCMQLGCTGVSSYCSMLLGIANLFIWLGCRRARLFNYGNLLDVSCVFVVIDGCLSSLRATFLQHFLRNNQGGKSPPASLKPHLWLCVYQPLMVMISRLMNLLFFTKSYCKTGACCVSTLESIAVTVIKQVCFLPCKLQECSTYKRTLVSCVTVGENLTHSFT